MRLHRLFTAIFSAFLSGLFVAAPELAAAQSLFSPAIRVNDQAVTYYELRQRIALLEALNAPGDREDTAKEALIDERLQIEEAKRLGITVSDAAVTEGMAEFAARANLTTQQFLAEVGKYGVAKETFRDFVKAGLLWRGVIRERFGPRARAQVTEADIERARIAGTGTGGAQVLLAEMFLRADTPEYTAQSEAFAEQIKTFRSFEQFSDAARQISLAPSRENGGQVEWMNLSNLPPPLAAQLLSMSPGEVTEPIPVRNAIALFQLRGLRDTGQTSLPPSQVKVDFLLVALGENAAAKADRVRETAASCDDVYGRLANLPEDRFRRETLAMTQVPNDLALDLARLDPGEITLRTNDEGMARDLLMLCGRAVGSSGETPERDEIRQRLIGERVNAMAQAYIAELRADAIIIYP